MPPALDRLLASPSALRLLRSIVNGSDIPAACSPSIFCAHTICTRNHSTDRVKQHWRRWKENAKDARSRDRIRKLLESDETPIKTEIEEQPAALEDGQDTLLDSTEARKGAKSNAERWAGSLYRRERYHGQRGIMEIWNLRRHAQSYLPADNTPHAEYLWGTFIKHPKLVEQVIDHAAELLKETKQTYLHLYALVMTYWLPRDARKALEYHRLMLVKLEPKELPLKKLARYGQSTFNPAAYEALLEMYRNSDRRDLYDEVVPSLIEKGHINIARRWHILCTSRDDVPSDFVANHPVIHILMAESSMLSKSNAPSKESTRQGRKYNEELMRRLQGRDAAPVRFEDSFCARMFATKTFAPDSIIQGLAIVGVNEIGPQAVHAMASRTQPLEELPLRFEELRAVGIALQGCVYSLAIEKFAKEQNWKLVRSMLDSDQHPDVFDDAQIQRKLLDFYLDQKDHVQVQRTLAILTLFHNDSSEESWNLLLQTHIKRTGPQHVTEVLQDMRARGVMVSIESVAAIKSLLRRRQRGRKPTTSKQGSFDDLRFVARVYMTILEFGMGPVSPITWRELIRRFGMTGRFRELRRLLLWLLCWYAPRSSVQFANLPVSPVRHRALERLRIAYPERNHYFHFPGMLKQRDNELHPVRQLFPPSLQQALIIWGFRAGLLPHANLEQSLLGSILEKKHYRHRLLQQQVLRRARWSIGLRTVALLRDLGVYVHRHTVVKALQMQFTVLFGRGRSNKLENRVMEHVNTIPYSRYVREVNECWGSQLFREPQTFKLGMVHEHMWHPRLRRKTDRRASINLSEILGPDWHERAQESAKESIKPVPDDAAFKELERRFAAQAISPDPGFEWMYEASLDTTGVDYSGGRTRTRRARSVRAR
jgi:hypothetical protein